MDLKLLAEPAPLMGASFQQQEPLLAKSYLQMHCHYPTYH